MHHHQVEGRRALEHRHLLEMSAHRCKMRRQISRWYIFTRIARESLNRGYVLLPLAPEDYTRDAQASQVEPAGEEIENSPTDSVLRRRNH